MTWVTTCHILIRHARKLRKRNQPTQAVHADIDLVIFALRKLGKIFPLVGRLIQPTLVSSSHCLFQVFKPNGKMWN